MGLSQNVKKRQARKIVERHGYNWLRQMYPHFNELKRKKHPIDVVTETSYRRSTLLKAIRTLYGKQGWANETPSCCYNAGNDAITSTRF